MTKIVYNACYGGFSVSDAAMHRYAELKGLKLYPEKGRFGFVTYWTIPPESRPPKLEGEAWHNASREERRAHNESYRANAINTRDFERDDPILVQVLEELGEKANGEHACLRIRELGTGTLYRIDEYDGAESVMTQDDYTWKTA